jgi:hypothetical protein
MLDEQGMKKNIRGCGNSTDQEVAWCDEDRASKEFTEQKE